MLVQQALLGATDLRRGAEEGIGSESQAGARRQVRRCGPGTSVASSAGSSGTQGASTARVKLLFC